MAFLDSLKRAIPEFLHVPLDSEEAEFTYQSMVEDAQAFASAIAITGNSWTTWKSWNSFLGEFRVIVFGPIHKNDNSEFLSDTCNHASK